MRSCSWTTHPHPTGFCSSPLVFLLLGPLLAQSTTPLLPLSERPLVALQLTMANATLGARRLCGMKPLNMLMGCVGQKYRWNTSGGSDGRLERWGLEFSVSGSFRFLTVDAEPFPWAVSWDTCRWLPYALWASLQDHAWVPGASGTLRMEVLPLLEETICHVHRLEASSGQPEKAPPCWVGYKEAAGPYGRAPRYCPNLRACSFSLLSSRKSSL